MVELLPDEQQSSIVKRCTDEALRFITYNKETPFLLRGGKGSTWRRALLLFWIPSTGRAQKAMETRVRTPERDDVTASVA